MREQFMPGTRSHLVDYIYDFHVLRLIRNASSVRGATRGGCAASAGPSASDKLIRAGVTGLRLIGTYRIRVN